LVKQLLGMIADRKFGEASIFSFISVLVICWKKTFREKLFHLDTFDIRNRKTALWSWGKALPNSPQVEGIISNGIWNHIWSQTWIATEGRIRV
jgi:hypothetical protein